MQQFPNKHIISHSWAFEIHNDFPFPDIMLLGGCFWGKNNIHKITFRIQRVFDKKISELWEVKQMGNIWEFYLLDVVHLVFSLTARLVYSTTNILKSWSIEFDRSGLI